MPSMIPSLYRRGLGSTPSSSLTSLSLSSVRELLLARKTRINCPRRATFHSVSCALIEQCDSPVLFQGMDPEDLACLRAASKEFPPPPGVQFSYGTAGFRTEASLLKSTLFRTGVLAALRSLSTKEATGLMITASHNPLGDNGVKVADPSGGMLVIEWEEYANKLANASDTDSFLQVVEEIVRKEKISLRDSIGGKVFLGRDTRPSGEELLTAAKKGVEAVSGLVVVEKGMLTTPQLHWMVRAYNRSQLDTEQCYYDRLSCAFRSLLDLKPSGSSTINPVVVVDGANGIGARKLLELQKKLQNLKMDIRNTGLDGKGVLNLGVGADYVQKEKVLPQNFDRLVNEERCASIDGDADRLVYFYFGCKTDEDTPRLHLLDGDKIMALFATFLNDQLGILADAPEALSRKNPNDGSVVFPGYGPVTVGAAQTAYANGASTKYLKEELGIQVELAPTGVKHLHAKAAACDIGLYFEANGHGTILLKERFLEWLKQVNGAGVVTGEKEKAVKRLLAVSEMVNQAVGDALSGILMVELVLYYKGWSVKEWDTMYRDVPSRQLKVKVKDRSVITTTAAETRVASPCELQEALDIEIGKYESGRSFVRPSGTEDVVRVYAEAATQELADELALKVCALVHKHAGGIGPQPWLYAL